MKKKLTFTILGVTLAAGLVVGNITFAEKTDKNESQMMKNESQMMNNESMSSMMDNSDMSTMMNDQSTSKMMDAMNSPEGKEMKKSCNKYMESSQDKQGQPNSKDNGVNPKATSL